MMENRDQQIQKKFKALASVSSLCIVLVSSFGWSQQPPPGPASSALSTPPPVPTPPPPPGSETPPSLNTAPPSFDAAVPAAGDASAAAGMAADQTKAEDKPNVVASKSDDEIGSVLSPFNYSKINRRDPFVPYVAPTSTGTDNRPINPLEKFNLEDLRLVGVMWDVRSPKAMLMDPNKKIYVVEKNERVGRNNGFIASIREGELVVVETLSTPKGPTYASKVLRIKAKEVKN